MAAKANSGQINSAPSVKERIEALYNHSRLFEMIANCPQIGIYRIFSRELALCLAHMEGEVYQCGRAVEDFLQKNAQREGSTPSEAEYKRIMNDLANTLLLYGRVFEMSQKMSSSTPSSKTSMNRYRINSLVDRGAVLEDEGLSPMALFIREWILNPLVDFIASPSQDLLMRLPVYRRRYQERERDNNGRIINSKTVSAAANASVSVLAILILIAPIATFSVMKEQSLRIMIMPLFCLLLAASAQLMGSDAMPSYTIVIGYFQAMVFFIGPPNDV
ncbi:hypothetical protein ACET3X_006622 [Alternaria dauci]|uniref:DUF6594 domain-containing protein n=1 Tax=Alternaria dauci TaxID=48095 RepID=A0ABR3UE89_9PLEO